MAERLRALSKVVRVHVVTADTFGTAAGLNGFEMQVQVLPAGDRVEAKASFVRALGASQTIAIGNGSNDEAMVRDADVGIAIVGREGASARTLCAADIVVTHIEDALALLLTPARLIATL